MISASFLGIKDHLKENLHILDQTNISYLHFDIMDGKFVSNETWHVSDLLPFIQDLKKPFDVHFMVEDVSTYIAEFDVINPEYMTFHIEATDNPKETIMKIKHTGSKVGVSIKPSTSIDTILPYLDQIDLVLVMSVEPGAGGQSFLEDSLSKIEKLNQIREEQQYSYLIEVDGGINPITKKQCEQKGADLFVVGSFITNVAPEDYQKQIDQLS